MSWWKFWRKRQDSLGANSRASNERIILTPTEAQALLYKYRAVLEAMKERADHALPLNALPADKDRIKAALGVALQDSRNDPSRTALFRLAYLNLSRFQPGVSAQMTSSSKAINQFDPSNPRTMGAMSNYAQQMEAITLEEAQLRAELKALGYADEPARTAFAAASAGAKPSVKLPAVSLHDAAGNGNAELVKQLLANGADPNARESDGATPLFWAVGSRQTRAVELLLESGADVNAPNGVGGTPLHVAASLGLEDIAKLLLAKGARVDVFDMKGHSPVQAAGMRGHRHILALLEQQPGYSPFGRTPGGE